MSKIDDGGPAFPLPERLYENSKIEPFGMSLRDYFAGQAPNMPHDLERLVLQAADVDNPDKTHREKATVYLAVVAEWNLMYADAMLAARDHR